MTPNIKQALIDIGLRKLAAEAGAVMPPPDLPIVENPQGQEDPQATAEAQAAVEAAQAQQDAAPQGGDAPMGEEQSVDTAVFEMLLAAYKAEVCAAWRYEWARISALGVGRDYLVSECEEHRDEEWGHATAIADLLDSLGGTIPFSLIDIVQGNPTPGAPEQPNNRDTSILAHQLVEAEQGAVDLYSQIIEATKDGGPAAEMVNNLAVDILTTEQKHVADMIKVSYAIGG